MQWKKQRKRKEKVRVCVCECVWVCVRVWASVIAKTWLRANNIPSFHLALSLGSTWQWNILPPQAPIHRWVFSSTTTSSYASFRLVCWLIDHSLGFLSAFSFRDAWWRHNKDVALTIFRLKKEKDSKTNTSWALIEWCKIYSRCFCQIVDSFFFFFLFRKRSDCFLRLT